jgi:hypothetical protein
METVTRFGFRIRGSDYYFGLKKPEISESQISLQATDTMKMKMKIKMQMKTLEAKSMKVVTFWN